MSEKDKISEALRECARLLGVAGAEAMVVAAIKGKSVYRISNLSTDAEVKGFIEYLFNIDEATAAHSEVYSRLDNGELEFLGTVTDELN